jgi:hypothetical protein
MPAHVLFNIFRVKVLSPIEVAEKVIDMKLSEDEDNIDFVKCKSQFQCANLPCFGL